MAEKGSGIVLPYETSFGKLYNDRMKTARAPVYKSGAPLVAPFVVAPVHAAAAGVEALSGFGGNILSAMLQGDQRTLSEKGAESNLAPYLEDRIGSGIGSSHGSTRLGVPTPSGTAPMVSMNFGPPTPKAMPAPVTEKPQAPYVDPGPPDLRAQELPAPAPAAPPALASPPLELPKRTLQTALGYDDRQERAMKSTFNNSVEEYDNRMRPALGKLNDYLSQIQNAPSMGSSFGGLMANQYLAEALDSNTKRSAEMHLEDAKNYGDLSKHFGSELNSAIEKGSLNQRASALRNFYEGTPSTMAAVASHDASALKDLKTAEVMPNKAEHDKAVSDDKKAQAEAVEFKAFMEQKLKANPNISFGDLLTEWKAGKAGYRVIENPGKDAQTNIIRPSTPAIPASRTYERIPQYPGALGAGPEERYDTNGFKVTRG